MRRTGDEEPDGLLPTSADRCSRVPEVQSEAQTDGPAPPQGPEMTATRKGPVMADHMPRARREKEGAAMTPEEEARASRWTLDIDGHLPPVPPQKPLAVVTISVTVGAKIAAKVINAIQQTLEEIWSESSRTVPPTDGRRGS